MVAWVWINKDLRSCCDMCCVCSLNVLLQWFASMFWVRYGFDVCSNCGGMGFINGFAPMFFFLLLLLLFFFNLLRPVLVVKGEREVGGGGLPWWWWV